MGAAAAMLLLASTSVTSAAAAAVRDTPDKSWTRAAKLVAQMTLAEKVQLLQGTAKAAGPDPEVPRPYVGRVAGIERLGIPDLNMNDGPEGFRCIGTVCPPGSTTQFPSGLTVAHAWDASLFGEWGEAMGKEFADKGANVQFGPGANVARIANGGRSFEYVSG
jgi:beta-glucosidase